MKIMLGTHYSVDVMLNALPSIKVNLNIGLQSPHSFIKRMRVSNACNTDFRLFIVLGDEFNIQYFPLHLGRV